jgi:hypothetical protein
MSAAEAAPVPCLWCRTATLGNYHCLPHALSRVSALQCLPVCGPCMCQCLLLVLGVLGAAVCAERVHIELSQAVLKGSGAQDGVCAAVAQQHTAPAILSILRHRRQSGASVWHRTARSGTCVTAAAPLSAPTHHLIGAHATGARAACCGPLREFAFPAAGLHCQKYGPEQLLMH